MIDEENRAKLAEMPNSQKKARIRALYISTSMSIPTLAEEFVVPKTTIYGWSKKEKWALMKKKATETIIEEKTQAVIDVAYDSIDFWTEYQANLRLRLKEDITEDGIGGAIFVMTTAELKHLGEAWERAEERMFLLRGVYIDV